MNRGILLVSTASRWLGTARMPRCLARAGFEVSLLAPRGSLALHSRFVARSSVLRDEATPMQWLLSLVAMITEVEPRLVIPVPPYRLAERYRGRARRDTDRHHVAARAVCRFGTGVEGHAVGRRAAVVHAAGRRRTYLRAGQLKAIAVTSEHRVQALPGCPRWPNRACPITRSRRGMASSPRREPLPPSSTAQASGDQ